ncbi:MAG: hypothetical protein ACYC2G_01225 [Gemmatimonadaceae bacterium]
MSSRDWEKELAAIDRQIASVPDTPPGAVPDAGQHAGMVPRSTPPAASAGGAPLGMPVVRSPSPGRRWMLYVRLVVALALAVGIVFWPYGTRCGLELGGYLAGVGLIAIGGLWSAVWSWRHRAGKSHVLSLLILLWALGLAAWQTLPRVGLAVPTMERPAVWACN